MEEKHKFLLIFNFVLFPVVMIIISVLTFQGTDTHIEYVDPVDVVCPRDDYIQKGNFCHVSGGCDNEETCEKISVTCPPGKYLKLDADKSLCYSLIQYSDPVEPECPPKHFQSGDVCLPHDATIDEHETRKTALRCKEGRVLRNMRCFVMSELIEQPCQKKQSLDKNSNTCDVSNKSEESIANAVKCSSDNSNEEQVSFNNKCYKEQRIIAKV